MLNIAVVTLFPEWFDGLRRCGVPARALQAGLLRLSTWNPRDYATDRYRSVDDRPYGGGPGMVMMVAPLRAAVRAARADLGAAARCIYLCPQGRRLTQPDLRALAARGPLVLVAGRYEGVDERLVELEIDEQWSIGDYVLSGGEPAAAVFIDALTRLQPGALGNAESSRADSFADGLLEHPHYTRPSEYEERRVPEVLLGGNHEDIRRWRLKQSLGRTWRQRPDLLAGLELSREQRHLLSEYINEQQQRDPGME